MFEIFFWLDYSWGAGGGGGGGIDIPTCSSSLTSSMIAGLIILEPQDSTLAFLGFS